MQAATSNVVCLADLVGIATRRNPRVVAIEHEHGSLTYGELWRRVQQCANALIALELPAGARVVIFAQNAPEYLETYLALQCAGLVAVPANYRLSGEELLYILENSGADALIVGEEYLHLLASIRSRISTSDLHVIVYGEPDDGQMAYEHLIGAESDEPCARRATALDPAAIFYTSGTTGFPKGAVLSHLAILSRFSSWGWRFGITAEDVTLVPGPIFHQSFGSIALVSLCVGARTVLRREFRGEAIADDIKRYGVSWSFLVPNMIGTLLETMTSDISVGECQRLRGVLSSGSRLPTLLIDAFEQTFPTATLSDAYGWTESGWITYCRHADLIPTNRSLGQASFGCAVAVLDDEGRELPPGEAGQIYASNPVPFLGYHNDPAATSEMRHGPWETGGDVGFVDDEGFLHLLDRKRDTIISGGENIYPAEIERVLIEHPKVADVAVVGVQDRQWGEHPRACIVMRDGEDISEQEILHFCEGKIASYKHPRSICKLETLPRNSMGKVLRRVLREKFWDKREEII